MPSSRSFRGVREIAGAKRTLRIGERAVVAGLCQRGVIEEMVLKLGRGKYKRVGLVYRPWLINLVRRISASIANA